MRRIGKLGIAVAAAFFCFGGIGLVPALETAFGSALAAPAHPDGQSADPKARLTLDQTPPVLDLRAITSTSADFTGAVAVPSADPQLTLTTAPTALPAMPRREAGSIAAPQPACTPRAIARPVAGAMVELTLDAPCLPNERITVHHTGMIFTETTSAAGSLTVSVPALAQEAVFILAFANGDAALATVDVRDFGDYDRSVLQWQGNAGFAVHAREFGAGYGDRGHVWREAAGDLDAAVHGDSGLLTALGARSAADPFLAEVYTFPRSASRRTGEVVLSVETEIAAANCGEEVEAQVLEVRGGSDLSAREMRLNVPDCAASGSFLVLNNLLRDLKVAAR